MAVSEMAAGATIVDLNQDGKGRRRAEVERSVAETGSV
jgi:hypothetical protein